MSFVRIMTKMYCYVGDLLGFKKTILNLPPEDQADRVKEWIRFVLDGIKEFNLPKYHLVSDTIFAGADNSREGLENLLKFSKYMLENGIQKSFPLRGAIAFGDVTWDEHISYGEAIVHAYNLANDQIWIGTACSYNLPHLDVNSPFYESELLIAYPVPEKTELISYRATVVWQIPSSKNLITLTSTRGLMGDKERFKSSYANIIQNTLMYSSYIDKVRSMGWPFKGFYGMLPIELIANTEGDIYFPGLLTSH